MTGQATTPDRDVWGYRVADSGEPRAMAKDTRSSRQFGRDEGDCSSADQADGHGGKAQGRSLTVSQDAEADGQTC